MERLNAPDPLETRLRKIPPTSAPAGVFDRLQKKASWNQPSIPNGTALTLAALFLLGALALAWFGISQPASHPLNEKPFSAPAIVASLPPILAAGNQAHASSEDDPLEDPQLRKQFREPTIAGFGCETRFTLSDLLREES